MSDEISITNPLPEIGARISAEPAKKSAKSKNWSRSIGPWGHRVRVFAADSGIIYAEMRSLKDPTKYVSVSLKTRDRNWAVAWAKKETARWQAGDLPSLGQGKATLSHLLALHATHRSAKKVESERKADERRSQMWARFLGGNKDVHAISYQEWEDFIAKRRTGEIDANGEIVDPKQWKPVRDGTIAADLHFLRGVLHFGCKWREGDRYLVREDVTRGFEIPRERNIRRPVVNVERFAALRAAAEKVRVRVGGKKARDAIIPARGA